ncbi:MAG: hypothetical protein WD971_05900 [Pirellulales bacterium]
MLNHEREETDAEQLPNRRLRYRFDEAIVDEPVAGIGGVTVRQVEYGSPGHEFKRVREIGERQPTGAPGEGLTFDTEVQVVRPELALNDGRGEHALERNGARHDEAATGKAIEIQLKAGGRLERGETCEIAGIANAQFNHKAEYGVSAGTGI